MNKMKSNSGKESYGNIKGGFESKESLKLERSKTGRIFTSLCRIRSFDGKNNSFFKFVEPYSSNTSQILSVNTSAVKSKLLTDLGSKFHFDYIFDEGFSQLEVFQEACLELIENLLEKKKSSLLLAQGLNDSGKSYTIVGDAENPGILPLCLRLIYDKTKIKKESIQIFCNYVEIFDQFIYDLLSPENKKKVVSLGKGINCNVLKDAFAFKLETIQDFSNALNTGNKRKRMDNKSSLSHTLFKIIIRFPDKSDKTKLQECSLSIIDLAFPFNREFININEDLNSSKIVPDPHKIDLYYIHHALCKSLKDFSELTKLKKGTLNNIKMDSCHLVHYLKYYLYGEEDIVLLTNIKPSLDSIEENLKVLDFSRKFMHAINYLDNYFHKFKINKSKLFESQLSRDSRCELNLIEEEFSPIGKVEDELSSTNFTINHTRNLLTDFEVEKMKNDYQGLLKKFEEQQIFIKSLMEKENQNLDKVNNFVNKNIINTNEILKELDIDKMVSKTSMFNIIFISPKVETFNVTNSTAHSEQSAPKKNLPSILAHKEVKGVKVDSEQIKKLTEEKESNNQHIESKENQMKDQKNLFNEVSGKNSENNIQQVDSGNKRKGNKEKENEVTPKKTIKLENESESYDGEEYFKSYQNLKKKKVSSTYLNSVNMQKKGKHSVPKKKNG